MTLNMFSRDSIYDALIKINLPIENWRIQISNFIALVAGILYLWKRNFQSNKSVWLF